MLTWSGCGGRSQERDQQQDEEEQVEDPHGCQKQLAQQMFYSISAR